MKSRYPGAICAALVLVALSAYGQNLPQATIRGVVKEVESGAPVVSASVFIANTTLGDATDAQGVFEITRVPPGTHQLVVSIIGYETQTRSIRVASAARDNQNFNLKPKTLEAPAIEVVAEPPHEWRKNLKKFEGLFWGASRLVSECKIVNPEVLDFNTPEGENAFIAGTQQPLALENHGLGFQIEIILLEFKQNLNDESLRYQIIPHFTALAAASDREERKWQQNRLRAYRGSLRHFYRALIANRLLAEGFRVFRMPALPWLTDRAERRPVTSQELLTETSVSFERQLRLPEYLEVRYDDEKEGEQISWLDGRGNPITLNISGYVTGPFDVMVYGYWAGQRVAEMLPRDYEP